MTVQFINSLYASDLPNYTTMNPNYLSPAKQIGMRYQQLQLQMYQMMYNPVTIDKDEDSELQTSTNSTTKPSSGSTSSSSGSSSSSSGSTSATSNKKYTIAVVDFCDNSDSDIDLDGDGKGDMAHGNVVASMLKATFQNSDVYTFDITKNSAGSTNDRLVASLQSILDEIKSGSCKYDALNLSLSSRITYSDLSKALGKTITKDNVSKYASEIRNWLVNQGSKNGYSTTAKVVQLLEQIEAAGCDIYVAAANVNDGSDDELNLYTIATSTTSVGALNKSGSKASFSFNNSLIDKWALGEIEVKKVKDSNGNFAGYDINGDGKVDIGKSYTSGGSGLSTNAYLKGTSFASPYQLIQDLK